MPSPPSPQLSPQPSPLPDHSAAIAAPGGGLRFGRVTGRLHHDPLRLGPRRGRARRWLYAATGGRTADGRTVVAGAAVVAMGPVLVAFAYATIGTTTATFDARSTRAPGRTVGRTPPGGARFDTRTAHLGLTVDGSIEVEVPTAQGALALRTRTTSDVLPVVLATPTPGGGWNVTEKAAGTGAALELTLSGAQVAVADAHGWRDWTSGRQDRRTTWRWAAGAGPDKGGRRIGLNASTGMNGAAQGEDLLWADGLPQPLDLHRLAPVDADATGGAWQVRGPGTRLDLVPTGERSRREELGPIVSDYTQPIGQWRGTVPGPAGTPAAVELFGVAEDHLAVW